MASTSTNSIKGSLPVIYRLLLISLVLLALFFLFGEFWPIGPDYYYTFRPVAEAFLSGETGLYDSNGYGYYNAPWGIILLLPTLLFSLSYGQAIISLITITGLFFAIYAVNDLGKGRGGKTALIAIVLAAASLHTFDLLIRGNIEGFLLYGLGLSWMGVKWRRPLLLGFGLLLLSIKPPNVLLAIIVFIWATRDWSFGEKVKSIIPVGLAFLISLFVLGYDWPIRYFRYYQDTPPFILHQTSLWKTFEYFGLGKEWAYLLAIPVLVLFILTVLRTDAQRYGVILLGLAIATNLVISPYALGSHYVLLAPFLVMLAGISPWFLLVWLFTLTPLLRLIWGYEIIWIDNIYPLVLMVILLLLLWQRNKDRLLDRMEKTLELSSI